MPSYDRNGNLTSDGSNSYTYTPDRARGRQNRLVAASGGNTTFLYDGDALVAEYDYAGAVKHRYVHGSGTDEPLMWYEGASVSHANLRPLYADAQGSIVAVSDFAGHSIAVNDHKSRRRHVAAQQQVRETLLRPRNIVLSAGSHHDLFRS